MKECDMFPAVSSWLASRGFDVRAEVGVRGAPVDVVAVRGDRIVACEMKLSWSGSLLRKLLYDIAYWANEVWFACPGRVSAVTMSNLERHGVGVYSVSRGVLVRPMEMYEFSDKLRSRAFDKFRRAPSGLVGGVPMLKGCGPREACVNRICDYMATHPKAKSREVFENVPNHYASFASFSGAFGAMIRNIRTAANGAIAGAVA